MSFLICLAHLRAKLGYFCVMWKRIKASKGVCCAYQIAANGRIDPRENSASRAHTQRRRGLRAKLRYPCASLPPCALLLFNRSIALLFIFVALCETKHPCTSTDFDHFVLVFFAPGPCYIQYRTVRNQGALRHHSALRLVLTGWNTKCALQ